MRHSAEFVQTLVTSRTDVTRSRLRDTIQIHKRVFADREGCCKRMAITLYGTHWCVDCKRAKQFFGEHRVSYEFVDIDGDRNALEFVEKANHGKHIIPVIEFDDKST